MRRRIMVVPPAARQQGSSRGKSDRRGCPAASSCNAATSRAVEGNEGGGIGALQRGLQTAGWGLCMWALRFVDQGDVELYRLMARLV